MVVVIQSNKTKKWLEHAEITAERKVDDGSVKSYEVLMGNGRTSHTV